MAPGVRQGADFAGEWWGRRGRDPGSSVAGRSWYSHRVDIADAPARVGDQSLPRRLLGLIPLVLLLIAMPHLVRWIVPSHRHVAAYEREHYERALRELRAADGARSRYYALGSAAKTAVYFGSLDEAHGYAVDLLRLATTTEKTWNFGNAIHDGHEVLGLVLLRQGRLDEAEEELLLAGDTPGSPQLDTFGPNLMLAKELLEQGRTAAVLPYFDKCRRSWKMERGRLDQWTKDAEAGRTPDFGANLLF